MRIAIHGTGGAGGYFGAQLARSGEDVTFIGRGEHLKTLQAHGLRTGNRSMGQRLLLRMLRSPATTTTRRPPTQPPIPKAGAAAKAAADGMSGAACSRNRLSAVMVRCFPGAASRFRLGRAPAVARYRGQTSATRVPDLHRLPGVLL
jgi:Ketopantoate reductase PanE/ApbA